MISQLVLSKDLSVDNSIIESVMVAVPQSTKTPFSQIQKERKSLKVSKDARDE